MLENEWVPRGGGHAFLGRIFRKFIMIYHNWMQNREVEITNKLALVNATIEHHLRSSL